MEPKKVLIICYDYVPIESPHAFRWSAISEKWVENGHEVHILSICKPGLKPLEIIKGVTVHRVSGGFIEKLRKHASVKVSSAQGRDRNEAKRRKFSSEKWIASALKLLHDHTWKKLYWPDYACLWYFPAYRKVKQLYDQYAYDFVISVSHPYTCHMVANRLKTKKPEIVWLVDVGDPFCILKDTPTNNRLLYNDLNYRHEYKVFKNADAVSVTPEAEPVYRKVFPEGDINMNVIPPMLTIHKMPEPQKIFDADGKIRFVFIGTLYRKIRNPDFLLRLFLRMLNTPFGEQLELHFFGNVQDCEDSFKPYEYLFHSQLFLHGIVDHRIALNAMHEANVLVNISNKTPLQLPSKVVEYASTGNRVLNIVEIDNDNSELFFNRYPGAITVHASEVIRVEEAAQLLEELMKLDKIDGEQLSSWMEPYQLDSISNQFFRILSHG